MHIHAYIICIYTTIYTYKRRGFYIHVIVDLAGVYGGLIPSMCDKLVCYHEPPQKAWWISMVQAQPKGKVRPTWLPRPKSIYI